MIPEIIILINQVSFQQYIFIFEDDSSEVNNQSKNFIENDPKIGCIGRLWVDFGANDMIFVGTGALIRLRNDILGVLTTAHNLIQKRTISSGEVKLKQAVEIEFFIGLDGDDNYMHKFHIYNFFVHPGYVQQDDNSCYNIAIALIDLENVEPSLEEISIDSSDSDLALKPIGIIPESLISKIGEFRNINELKEKDEIFVGGYPLSCDSKLLGMHGKIDQILNAGNGHVEKNTKSSKLNKDISEFTFVKQSTADFQPNEDIKIMTYSNLFTSSGQSGSPVMQQTEDGWKIIGIHIGDSKQDKSKSL